MPERDYAARLIHAADEFTELHQAIAIERERKQQAEDEITDLRHAFELYPMDATQRARVAKEMTTACILRREAKDALFILEKMENIIKGNKGFANTVDQLRASAERAQKTMESRYYQPRTDVLQRLKIIDSDEGETE